MGVAYKTSVRVVKNDLPTAGTRIRRAIGEEVERAAINISAGAIRRTPPRIDTGTLVASWTADRITETLWAAYSDQEHSIYNEFGTYKMAAHPMLRPSATEELPRLVAALSKRLEGLR